MFFYFMQTVRILHSYTHVTNHTFLTWMFFYAIMEDN